MIVIKSRLTGSSAITISVGDFVSLNNFGFFERTKNDEEIIGIVISMSRHQTSFDICAEIDVQITNTVNYDLHRQMLKGPISEKRNRFELIMEE